MKITARDFGLNKIEISNRKLNTEEEEIRNKFPIGSIVKFKPEMCPNDFLINALAYVIGYVYNNDNGVFYLSIYWHDQLLMIYNDKYLPERFERVM